MLGRLRLSGGFVAGVLARFVQHDGPGISGHIAFSAFVGLFPFIAILITIAGSVGKPDAVMNFMALIFDLFPSPVSDILRPAVQEFIAMPRSGLLSVSAVITLWMVSSGVESIRTALNRAYGVSTVRPFWRRRLGGFALVILGSAAILVAITGLLAIPLLESLLTVEGAKETLGLWWPIRYILVGVVVLLVICAGHRWLPNVRVRWTHILPGAMICTILWSGVAILYAFYLENLADMNLIYGSLSGIISVLVFFYILGICFVLGAEVNGEIERRSPTAE
jgi:membrane protein